MLHNQIPMIYRTVLREQAVFFVLKKGVMHYDLSAF